MDRPVELYGSQLLSAAHDCESEARADQHQEARPGGGSMPSCMSNGVERAGEEVRGGDHAGEVATQAGTAGGSAYRYEQVR